MRHGESRANVAGIILSHPEHGQSEEFALSPKGEEQVRCSASQALASGILDCQIFICSSPFSRARKTAEIAGEVLCICRPIELDSRLRERWFGRWERMPDSNYQKVWESDGRNPDHAERGVESAVAVQQRVMALIGDWEAKYSGKKILLVSHGDALQILQTGLHNLSAALHRHLPHLGIAEIRRLA